MFDEKPVVATILRWQQDQLQEAAAATAALA
jgi:hypothetical protein